MFAGLQVEGTGPIVVGGGPIVVGSSFGAALVVFNGPLPPSLPRAVEDADVHLPFALQQSK